MGRYLNLDELRVDIAKKQKKGLPFICSSVIIWLLILVVVSLKMPIQRQNMLVFCCSCVLMPLAWLAGKLLRVDIFDKSNALGNLGFLFTLNQFLYILIVMWVFSAAPDRMVMVYAMVFGAHLLPIGIPILSLVLGCLYSSFAVATTMIIAEVIFVVLLFIENRWLCQS